MDPHFKQNKVSPLQTNNCLYAYSFFVANLSMGSSSESSQERRSIESNQNKRRWGNELIENRRVGRRTRLAKTWSEATSGEAVGGRYIRAAVALANEERFKGCHGPNWADRATKKRRQATKERRTWRTALSTQTMNQIFYSSFVRFPVSLVHNTFNGI